MKHVLLIDDNQIDIYITEHILKKNHIADKITKQTSAIDALKFLESLKNSPDEFPDTIFLDIQMPEMDGFGFLEAFNDFSESIREKCTVLMLTSSNDQQDIKRSFEYPVVKKFLTKPFSLKMLTDM